MTKHLSGRAFRIYFFVETLKTHVEIPYISDALSIQYSDFVFLASRKVWVIKQAEQLFELMQRIEVLRIIM